MEASLRRAAAEIGEARLLKSLQEKNAPVKGIAILEPERLSEREVKARVEYVFADRNEVQIVYLEKAGERWKIARVEGAQRIETLVPYGTPVSQLITSSLTLRDNWRVPKPIYSLGAITFTRMVFVSQGLKPSLRKSTPLRVDSSTRLAASACISFKADEVTPTSLTIDPELSCNRMTYVSGFATERLKPTM